MAQHDYNIANQTGANFRADLNNALLAISSNNSGSSEPSTMYAYEWWIDTSSNVLKLRNSSNNAWITMPFSITADNTVDINAGTVNGITSFSFSSGATVTSILDEDDFSSDSATALATQQSIKAYIASQITLEDLDITDGSSTISIDLDSETLSLLGGTGVTSTASGNGVTFAIGQSVGTSDNVVFNQVTGALVGNASTATALATARTISGVSFDGTANITLDTDNIGEGSSNLYFTAERVDDQVNTLLTAGANISLTYDDAAGTLTIANTNTADITSVIAGNGLTGGGTAGDVTLAVGVDDSSIEISSDALRVKATGVTNAMLAGSIANSKLANSSITVNSQAIALGGSHTFDTDDIGEGSSNLYFTNERTDDRVAALIQNGTGISFTYNDSAGTLTPVITLSPFDTDNLTEGSSNLYYTDTRANSAIDARVTNTFINNLSGVVADTSTALATARSIAIAGDVVGSASFDGTSDISISATIQANSVELGTDTTGNYIQTITGTANKISVSGSGSESADVTLTLPSDVQIANDLTVAGDLTVNGDLTYLDTTNLKIEDNLFELNANLTGSPVNDSGMLINRGNQNNAIFMWDESADKFALGLTTADGTSTGNITIASTSTLVANLEGNVTGTVSSISNHSTSDLSEGTNLYYTDARFDTRLGTKTTDNLTEGSSNLYYTDARFDTRLAAKTTDNLTEGSSNLYMTTERVQDIVGGMVTGNTETGITVTYDDSDGTLDFVVGTLNQDTTGNAATATALETARTIGGTSFDGTSNISVALADTATALATARNIGGVSFDGTSNIDLAGVNTTGNQDTTGNAATATKLATARTIGGTSFDGSANISVALADTATILANARTINGVSFDGSANITTLTAGTGVSVSGTEVAIGQAVSSSDSPTFSNLTLNGTDSIKVPAGTTAQRNGSPAAGMLRYNTTTGEFEGYSNSWGAIGGGSGSFSTNIFAGDGSDTTFTLSAAPSNENNLLVFVDGVFQAHDVYSVSGTTLTFATAPANGRVITVYNAEEVSIGTPSDNSVSTVKIQDDAVTSAKLDTNISIAGTLASTGVLTANAGVVVDNITIDGSTITSSSDITLDAVGDIILDADGDDIKIAEGGTVVMEIKHESSSMDFTLNTGNDDFKFKGTDDGANITALQLDMSEGGKAIFNAGATFGGAVQLNDNQLNIHSSSASAIIGSIGNTANDLNIFSSSSGHNGLRFHVNGILPTDNSGTIIDNDADLGDPSYRFKSLYLSSKVFLGGMTLTSNDAGRIGFNRNPDDGSFVNSSSLQRFQINGAYSGGDYLDFQNYDSSGNYVGGFRIEDGAIRAEPLGVSTPSYSFDNDTDTGMTRPTGNTLQLVTGGTERVRVDSSGRVGIGESAPSNAKLEILQAGDHDAHSTHGIAIHSTGNTNFTSMYMGCEDGIDSAYIQSVALDGSFTSKSLLLNPNGGKVLIATKTTNPVNIGNHRLVVDIDSSNSGIAVGADGLTDTRVCMSFYNDNGTVGSITTNASATAYNTSSDYRLKENVVYDFNALDRVAQLKPARFNFISDEDITLDGFLAHEVQDIVPEAITGEKDGVKEEEYEITPAVLDDDENVVTEAEMGIREVPDYQGIDQSKLVPLLTKAIQEQQTIIDDLKSRVEILEGA